MNAPKKKISTPTYDVVNYGFFFVLSMRVGDFELKILI